MTENKDSKSNRINHICQRIERGKDSWSYISAMLWLNHSKRNAQFPFNRLPNSSWVIFSLLSSSFFVICASQGFFRPARTRVSLFFLKSMFLYTGQYTFSFIPFSFFPYYWYSWNTISYLLSTRFRRSLCFSSSSLIPSMNLLLFYISRRPKWPV